MKYIVERVENIFSIHPTMETITPEQTLKIAKHLDKAKKCVFITGAGISVSGGIPVMTTDSGLSIL